MSKAKKELTYEEQIERLEWMCKDFHKEVNRMYHLLMKQMWRTIHKQNAKKHQTNKTMERQSSKR